MFVRKDDKQLEFSSWPEILYVPLEYILISFIEISEGFACFIFYSINYTLYIQLFKPFMNQITIHWSIEEAMTKWWIWYLLFKVK